MRVPHKKKDSTDVYFKQKGENNPKHQGAQRYCIIFKKSGMPEHEHIPHRSEDCFGKRSDQKSIKDGLEIPMVIMAEDMKQYNKSEHKWKKDLKARRKKNKMFYSIANKYGFLRELKKIKKIKAKSSKKR